MQLLFSFLLALSSFSYQPSENKRNSTLDCLSILLGSSDSSRFILPVLKTICSQHVEFASTRCNRKETESLEILSNDIKESLEVLPSEESDTDEEDHLIGWFNCLSFFLYLRTQKF